MKSEKPFTVVLRNLHPTTPCNEVKSELVNLNFSVIQVVNVLQRQTKTLLPLFFVDLEKIDNYQSIFEISSILPTKIKVEEPHKRRDLVQCQNCQDYGHTHSYCNYAPRCVRCGQNHHSKSCTKTIDTSPTCALCQGQHPANYRGRQIHKQLQLQRNRQTSLKYPPLSVNPSKSQADPLTTSQTPQYLNNQPKHSYAQATSGTNQNPLSSH